MTKRDVYERINFILACSRCSTATVESIQKDLIRWSNSLGKIPKRKYPKSTGVLDPGPMKYRGEDGL